MKGIFSLRKHSYLKIIGTFLIAIALIAGIVGCEGEGETYDLTMAVNPAGTGTATDDTGGSPYEEGDDVDITAIPADCYRFVSWSAPAGTFANANNATTVFTMPAQDVTVTANFEAVPPDHYKFYFAEWEAEPPATLPVDVKLKDQFGTFDATVGDVWSFGNPVEKVHATATSPINDANRHYTLYHLDYDEGWMPSSFQVTINNQFQDDVQLTVQGPVALAVPTQKEDQAMSDCIDHLLLYTVLHPVEYVPAVIGEVDLYDQFHDELGVEVYEPMFFANPVEKTIVDTSEVTPTVTDDHYVFYPFMEETFEKSGLPITNQFGDQVLDIGNPALLAVPSQKIGWGQPLNHFKTYWAQWPMEPPPLWEPPLPVDVQLEDQLVTINATVTWPYLFANPVEKRRMVEEEEEITPIWDPKDHLTLYWIEPSLPPMTWEVTVDNQFGKDQVLYVEGPYWLAVPTGKFTPDWPADVNHYLVYEVVDYYGEYPGVPGVYIRDQFFIEGGYTTVNEPGLFAVPAQKTHDGVTPIMDNVHLVFYWIFGIEPWNMDSLPVVNQFGEQYLYVYEDEYNFLGVPSEKTAVDGPWGP
jgi:hypothetical protein